MSGPIEVAYFLWKTNPLANWIIEVVTAFVSAKGLPVSCDNDDVKKVLEDFWYDPVNRMDIHWENFVRELGIYGEQCWPVFVAQQTGRVRMGYIDPALIRNVYADPHNVKIKVGLTVGSTNAEKARRMAIVLDGENEAFLSEEGPRAARDVHGRLMLFLYGQRFDQRDAGGPVICLPLRTTWIIMSSSSTTPENSTRGSTLFSMTSR